MFPKAMLLRMPFRIVVFLSFMAFSGIVFAKSPSSVTLTSSANPSNYGTAVTFTASVSPTWAAGTVTFKNGSTTLGTGTIVGGVATFSSSTLPPGSNSITASYGGDAYDTASLSPALIQTVNKLNSTVALVSSVNPSSYGSKVTFTATVTPSTATGTVTFANAGVTLGSGTLSSGKATFSTSTLPVGSDLITASYGGNASYNSSTSPSLTQNVNPVSSTVALAVSANPSTYGSSITFTATVTPSAATGTVTFTDGSTSLGTGTITSGKTTFGIATLAAGSHSIMATYGGDTNDAGSASKTLTQTVKQATSKVALASTLNPSTYGSQVTLTASITPAVATGSVTFTDGTTAVGTVSISSGAASYSSSTLVVGSHSITASYGGDSNDTTSTSSTLTQKVSKANAAVVVISSVNPSAYGSQVTFTAAVTPSAATGTVTFNDGSTTLGSGTIGGGSATHSTSTLALGSHSITATYGGDTNDTSGVSSVLTQGVNQTSSSVALTSSPNPSSYGLGVTFTATVTPATATGTVTFADGGTALGSATISGGSAVYNTSTLGGGSHSITATYNGDTNDSSATSSPLSQIVNVAGLVSLAIVPANVSMTTGSGQQLTASGTFSDNSLHNMTANATWSSSDATVATVGTASGSQGFAMAIGSGSATITAAVGSVQTATAINVQVATGPNQTYSARTDNCVDGSESGCVVGQQTGEAGAPLLFQEGVSDPIPNGLVGSTISSGSCPSGSTPSTYPAYCPAPMNSADSDPDFGAYLVMATDDNTNASNSSTPYKAAWNMRSDGGWDAFSWDETLLLADNNSGGATILNVSPTAIHAQTCNTPPGCVNASGIHNTSSGPGDATHLAFGGSWAFSRVLGESDVLYERTKSATQVNRLVVSSSIATPNSGSLSRSLYVDFASYTPVPCTVMETAAPGNPTTYTASWAGSFQVADDGSVAYGMTGGYDWAASWTVMPVDTFILPTVGNSGKFGFQATAITGSGMTGTTEPSWCQTAGCSVTDSSSSGSVTWTNIDKLVGQAPGFDIVIYRPAGASAPGCTRINTRLGKIYRGTGNTAAAGYMTTNDQVACTRAGAYPSSCIMPDRFTLHEVGQVMNGQYIDITPTGGEAPNPPGSWNSGTLSCQASNTSWQGAYSSANSYTTHNVVSYSGLYYTALTAVPSGNGYAPSGTTAANAYWSNTESYCETYLYDTTSTLVAPVTDWIWGTGHAASGYAHKYYGALYRSMLYGEICPNCPVINGRLNPGTPMLLAPLPCDDHGTYRNAGTSDQTPMFAVTTDVPAWTTRYVAACYAEVCAFNSEGTGLTYRFGHTYNTGSSSYFQTQNNIGVDSPLGDLIAFGTDMMGTRGSNVAPNAACNNLRGQYRPAANGPVTYQDYVYPTSANSGGNIFQATRCGADVAGATCTEGSSLPNWDASCSTSCTDGGVTWTNVGPNSCRGDIVIMDANRAHPAP